jgi:hypothetical protein
MRISSTFAAAMALAGFAAIAAAQTPVQQMDSCNNSGGHWTWSADGTYGYCNRTAGSGAVSTTQLQMSLQNAVTLLINSWIQNAQQKAVAQAQLRAALIQRQQDLMRQQQAEKAAKLEAMIERLNTELKMEGYWGSLGLKLGDDSMGGGYGICGLPGIATGGERPDCGTAAGGDLSLKLGDNATATLVSPTPVHPTAVNPTQVTPTQVAATPVAPTPVAPTDVAPTPVAPTDVFASNNPELGLKLGSAATGGSTFSSAPADPAQLGQFFQQLPPDQQQRIISALTGTDAGSQSSPAAAQSPAPAPPPPPSPATPVPPTSTGAYTSGPAAQQLGQANAASQQAAATAPPVQPGQRAQVTQIVGTVGANSLEQAKALSGVPFDNAGPAGAAANLAGATPALLNTLPANQGAPVPSGAVTPAISATSSGLVVPPDSDQLYLFDSTGPQMAPNSTQAGAVVANPVTAPPDSDLAYLFRSDAPASPDASLKLLIQSEQPDFSHELSSCAPQLVDRYQRDSAFAQQVNGELTPALKRLDMQYKAAVAQAHAEAQQQMSAAFAALRSLGLLKPGLPLEQQEAASPALRNAVEPARQRILAAEKAADLQAATILANGEQAACAALPAAGRP